MYMHVWISSNVSNCVLIITLFSCRRYPFHIDSKLLICSHFEIDSKADNETIIDIGSSQTHSHHYTMATTYSNYTFTSTSISTNEDRHSFAYMCSLSLFQFNILLTDCNFDSCSIFPAISITLATRSSNWFLLLFSVLFWFLFPKYLFKKTPTTDQ